ncbi:hypothetical protein ACHWQZ_G015798 [Mnemiopsis leidyi]
MKRMKSIKSIILLFAILSTAETLCGLGQFDCKNECIGRERQCDGFDDCDDGSDEEQCDRIARCQPAELYCNATTVDGDVKHKCYNTSTDICKAGSWNSLCSGKEDVQNCRCNTNDGVNKPLRCPTDGECYPAKTLEDFCKMCTDTLICPQDDGTDVKCEGDYFSCAPHKDFSEATSVCLPLAAKCDGFKQCSDEPACTEPTIRLDTPKSKLLTPYMGQDVEMVYKVEGDPRPKFLFYHYNKEIPFGEDGTFYFGGTTIKMSSSKTNVLEYTYSITLKNVTEYFFGPYQAVVWSVGDNPIKLTDNSDGSFHHRILADEVKVELKGAPTVMMKAQDNTNLMEKVNYTWNSGSTFSLSCVATGKPEPLINFMIDDEYLYIEEEMMSFNITSEYDETTMSLGATLTFIKGTVASTPGVYSCQAENVLGVEKSAGSMNIDLIISPEITEFNGMEDGRIFYKSDAKINITCISYGYPNMWNKLYVNDAEVQVDDNDLVEIAVTQTSATIKYTYSSDVNATINCTAKNDPSTDEAKTVLKSVDFYPVVSPTITLEREKFELVYKTNFSTVITVTFTEALKLDQDLLAVSVTQDDGTALDDSVWELFHSLDDNIWKVTLSSKKPVKIANIASVKVVASDTIYIVDETMSIDVIAPLEFTQELEPAITINKGRDLHLAVSVLSKPATQTAIWKRDDTVLEDNGDTVTIGESLNQTTYITTYSLTLSEISEAQQGNISVEITHDNGNSVKSVMSLTVIDHPCGMDPHPCQNGAECIVNGTDYTCNCSDYYEGRDCENNTRCEGENNPCENDSTCINKPWNDTETPVYKCDCTFDYEGRNCGDKIDFCGRAGGGNEKCDTLSGNALCHNTYTEPDGFECYCKHTKGGQFCDMEQLCTPNTCENDGTCSVVGYGADRSRKCICKEGYQGDLCEDAVPGYCFHDCNDRAYCEKDMCLCDYPYYGETCQEQISDTDINIKIPARAYLLAHTAPTITEERIQRYILPVKIDQTSSSCRVARLAATEGGAGGHLDIGVSVTEVNDTTSVAMVISGMIEEVSVSHSLDQVVVESVVSISLLAADDYAVVSVGHADGTIVAMELKLVLPELPHLKLGDFEVGVGCDMALIGHVTAGPYTLLHMAAYNEGRSVYPLPACFYNPCLNTGECKTGEMNDQYCNCTGTGYSGDYCEIPAEDCHKGCLNGGTCHGGYCVCPLSFHGVLCEASHEVTGKLRLSGDVSHVMFTHSNITKVEVHITGLVEADIVSDKYLLVIGEEDNSVKIMVTKIKTLYMTIVRGKERGAYEGLGTLADFMDGDIFKIVLSLEEEIIITDPAGDPVSYTPTELPCADGFGSFSGLAVHGLAGVTSEVTVLINDVAVVASSGKGVVNSDVNADLCADACGSGVCNQLNNQITCSECPDSTNSVTCTELVCNETACQGHCVDNGECVCALGRAGENCDIVMDFGSTSMPVTTSSYYSYLKYSVESIMDMAVQVSFHANLEESQQSGLLAYVGNNRQHIALTLDKTYLHVVVHCSETIHEEASLMGVLYGEWLEISFSWADNFLTLSIDDIDDVQVETGECWFNMGTSLFLGGMPDSSVSSVKATFGPADFIMPLGATLVGGQSLGLSETHICDTAFSRCSVYGTESCVKEGDGYTCTCLEGWQGAHCDEPVIVTPCEKHGPCSEKEVCVEMGGEASCLCELPYTRNIEENLCEGELGRTTGFRMEGAMSYAVVFTNEMNVANNFDAMLQFFLSDDLTSSTIYDIASVVYLNGDGSEGYISLSLTVGNETDEQGNDSVSASRKYDAAIDILGVEQQLEPNKWHVIRIQTSGMGTTIDIDDKTYKSSVGVVFVSRLHIGAVENQAYLDCIGDIVINGKSITEINDGVGVKSCSSEVPTEYEEIIGAAIWAKLGLL